jgi:CRISPR type III-A-associated RAMP protein Csm4
MERGKKMIQRRTYKICTKLSGRLTQIPDSQKIFGALINQYASEYSEEQVSDFVKKVEEGEIYLSLSNMMPDGFFSTPQNFILDILERMSSLEKMDKKEIYKAVKSRVFLKKEQIKEIVSNPKGAVNTYPYVRIDSSQQLRSSVESTLYDLPGLNQNLYSVPEVTVVKVDNKDMEKERRVEEVLRHFCFYLSMDEEECDNLLIEVIKKAKEEKSLFFRGARSSQGFNTFTIEEISEISIKRDEGKSYLSLGMLLPRKINYKDSCLKLFTSQRRPYHESQGWKRDLNGRYISFIEAGSIIYPEENHDKMEGIGCSIKPDAGRKEIIFGNAFLLPISEKGEIKYEENEKI